MKISKYLESKSKDIHFTSDPQKRNASKAYVINERLKFHQPDEEVDEFIFEFDGEFLYNINEIEVVEKIIKLIELNFVYIPSQ